MKKRITIYLDEEVVERFKARAAETGAGYQTMINETLKKDIERQGPASKDSLPKTKLSFAEYLMTMPVIVGHDDLFERLRGDDKDVGDVFD